MPIDRHIHHPLQIDAAHVQMARDAIGEALKVLRQPAPDTFLGRETFKPFPKEHTENNILNGKVNSNPSCEFRRRF
ncbi:hypothetical protein [Bradyrhizobium sp. CCGB20]|uniref:hypothetical protein n=1 Tax=Bradyrhizobium sp. CCGB20 TaxID=2949633 RepID=UPI0020B1D68F|nr:hypothetical protein [Bradyrhizobium sp. CCGB20]MCP3401542.1 hypothetical protein [Bradyrhizobium sp. CCGB20]